MNCQTTQDLLNGYADGEMDLVNHLRIEKHLRGCPSCARAYKNQKTLKSAFAADSLYFQAPTDLRNRIKQSLSESDHAPSPTRKIWSWRLIPVVAAVAVIVVLMILLIRPGPTSEELVANDIVSAHIRSMMANHLTDVPSTDQHTVKPWFDGKLDFAPPVVDLAVNGFPLVGGRLDYAGGRPVAALVYQRRQHFINLFVFPSVNNSDSSNKMSMRQGYNLIHWSRSGMTFWAVSDLNPAELQEFSLGLEN